MPVCGLCRYKSYSWTVTRNKGQGDFVKVTEFDHPYPATKVMILLNS